MTNDPKPTRREPVSTEPDIEPDVEKQIETDEKLASSDVDKKHPDAVPYGKGGVYVDIGGGRRKPV